MTADSQGRVDIRRLVHYDSFSTAARLNTICQIRALSRVRENLDADSPIRTARNAAVLLSSRKSQKMRQEPIVHITHIALSKSKKGMNRSGQGHESLQLQG